MKDAFRAQQNAKKVKKKLAAIQIEAEENGVAVVVTAEQKIISIKIENDELLRPENKTRLENSILVALQRAMKKAQTVAAENMKEIMGDFGFGGLGG